MVRVDYTTLEHTVKASAKVFGTVARTNVLNISARKLADSVFVRIVAGEGVHGTKDAPMARVPSYSLLQKFGCRRGAGGAVVKSVCAGNRLLVWPTRCPRIAVLRICIF